jgi:hypothetical protein
MFVLPVSGLRDEEIDKEFCRHASRIYGAIVETGWTSSGLTTINHMSGGPLFGVWISPDRAAFDYTAIGIQSGWHRPSKQITAWSMAHLADLMMQHREAKRRSNQAESSA